MSECYKLVFRGEVLEGQHPAVVRRRLAASAGFADEALDKLFSGRPVVLKREADTATAAKYQVLFRKAGARLRVLPVETADAEVEPGEPPAEAGPSAGAVAPAAGAAAAPEPAGATSAAGFELLPAGSDLLRAEERTPATGREIDTSAMTLEGARFVAAAPEPDLPGPDVPDLTLAEVGSDLGERARPDAGAIAAPDLQVAEAGADLAPAQAAPTPPLDPSTVSFEVAPRGSDLGQLKPLVPPPPPDVSHLGLSPLPAADD